MGYFKYQKHLTDDRVIAIYQPHYVPGSDVRDSNPAMRGLRPGPREEYISDVYPIVLRISPKFPTGGMVSLIGVNFGKSGTACKVVFADVDAESCEVKSPDLAIIRLPSAAHYHISRVASMQPAFVEVKLHLDKRVGVSRIQIGSDAAADGGNAEYVRAEPSGPFADARRSTSQVTASVSIYITPPPPHKGAHCSKNVLMIADARTRRAAVGNHLAQHLLGFVTKHRRRKRTRRYRTCPLKISVESSLKPNEKVLLEPFAALKRMLLSFR
jgi:hypothetical protein